MGGADTGRGFTGKLSGREVYGVYGRCKNVDGDGCRFHAENVGLHQGF